MRRVDNVKCNVECEDCLECKEFDVETFVRSEKDSRSRVAEFDVKREEYIETSAERGCSICEK